MSEGDRQEAIGRILVALDASPHSLAALQAAAELASRLGVEILGLYVEDIRLLKLSEFPLARELTFFSASPRSFDRREAEQQLHAQARAARRALENLAQRSQLRWSFRVIQGVVPDELLAATQETDLLILGKVGWSKRRQLGSTTRIVILRAPRSALILPRGASLGMPVGVVYDGSAQAQKALEAAIILQYEAIGYLAVIILAHSVEEAQDFQAEVARRLRERGLRARYRWLVQPSITGLRRVFQAEGCQILVLPGESEYFSGEALADLINEMECPVLLAR
jgi:nucleotide-binding universal stress UspA family protein